MDTLIYFLVTLIVSALVIYIVGKLNLGVSISGCGAAIIAALVIAVIGSAVLSLLGILGIGFGGGWDGIIIYLVVAAVVLMIGDRFVPGMKVHGFTGALIGAIAIGAMGWIIMRLLGLIIFYLSGW